MKTIKESIFDDNHEEKLDDIVYLKKFNDVLNKRKGYPKIPTDRFGRELHIGDICWHDWGGEAYFIQIKDFTDDGDVIPTKDYTRIIGENKAYSSCCILIPRSQYNNFLKVIKNNK